MSAPQNNDNRRIPPDDDPRFNRWVRDIGPMAELPEVDIGRPMVAALALLCASALLVVAIGWTAYGFAVNVGVASPGALALIIVGTVLVCTGALGMGLSYRRRNK